MEGPQPLGRWSATKARNFGGDYGHLKVGRRYRGVREFRDYEGTLHPCFERWIFLGHSFVPYEDGLSLFVSLDGEHEWHIRMQDRAEEQGPILRALETYVVEDLA